MVVYESARVPFKAMINVKNDKYIKIRNSVALGLIFFKLF